MFVRKLVLSSVAIAGALTPAVCNSQSKPFEMTLERTQCYGSCPAYKVSIRSDGTVNYEGKEFVRVKGLQSSTVGSEAALKVLNQFMKVKYLSLKDSYRSIKNPDGTESFVTDLPTRFTSLTVDGKKKSVEDYVGAPEELVALENRIDEVTNSRKWVFVDGETVREMGQHGWNPKSEEAEQYLVRAARYGYEDVVQALLEIGVNPNTPKEASTPLQNARTARTVELLVRAGGDVNASVRGEYGSNAIQESAQYGSAEVLKALIDAGANYNYSDKYGETILMYAAISGDAAKLKLLLDAGAKVDVKSIEGKTALSYAEELLHDDVSTFHDVFDRVPKEFGQIVQLLRDAGAK
jgi:hypothetical protein